MTERLRKNSAYATLMRAGTILQTDTEDNSRGSLVFHHFTLETSTIEGTSS